MRTGIIFFAFVLLISKGYSQWVCETNAGFWTTTYGQCNSNGYHLVLYDEFDGDTLDHEKWRYAEQVVMNNPNHFVAYYPRNVEISNGTMKISTKSETVIDSFRISYGPDVWVVDTFPYTSGWVQSKYHFGYGKYEIRCKIPYGVAFWPAFWMQGAEEDTYSEIDVFEFWGRNLSGVQIPSSADVIAKTPKFTSWFDNTPSDVIHECATNLMTSTDFSADFHTFTVYWDYYGIRWHIDGNPTPAYEHYHFTNALGQPVDCNSYVPSLVLYPMTAYAQNPLNIIISQDVANTEQYLPPNMSSSFPGIYEIDYVKYYKQSSCTIDFTFNSYSDVYSNSRIFEPNMLVPEMEQNINTGQDMLIQTNTIMNNSTNPDGLLTSFIASESITVLPTTFIDKTSPTSFIIDPDLCNEDRNLSMVPDFNTGNPQTNFSRDSISLRDVRNLSVYPNPTAGVVTVVCPDCFGYGFELVDITGRTVQNSSFSSPNYTLDLTGLQNGIYYLRIFSESILVHSEKIIKY